MRRVVNIEQGNYEYKTVDVFTFKTLYFTMFVSLANSTIVEGRPQADARASSKFGKQFYFFVNFEFSRLFSSTQTSQLISFHFRFSCNRCNTVIYVKHL